MKKFVIKRDISDADLEKMIDRGGFSTHYMQFMSDGKLHVVFVKECEDTPPVAAPATASAKRITATLEMPVVTVNHTALIVTNNSLRAEVQARREQGRAEIIDIMQRYAKTRDEIDHDFKPFKLGVQQ